jgi:hypothetical protein
MAQACGVNRLAHFLAGTCDEASIGRSVWSTALAVTNGHSDPPRSVQH